jgi:rhodanese-related sulfurtransferase
MSEQESGTTDLGEEIDAEEARVMIAKGEARAIDVGDPSAAADARVPGAVVVGDRDLTEIAEEVPDEQRSAMLVFGDSDEEARKAAGRLRDAGANAAAVKGGLDAWSSAGGQVQPQADEEYEGPKLKQPGA